MKEIIIVNEMIFVFVSHIHTLDLIHSSFQLIVRVSHSLLTNHMISISLFY